MDTRFTSYLNPGFTRYVELFVHSTAHFSQRSYSLKMETLPNISPTLYPVDYTSEAKRGLLKP